MYFLIEFWVWKQGKLPVGFLYFPLEWFQRNWSTGWVHNCNLLTFSVDVSFCFIQWLYSFTWNHFICHSANNNDSQCRQRLNKNTHAAFLSTQLLHCWSRATDHALFPRLILDSSTNLLFMLKLFPSFYFLFVRYAQSSTAKKRLICNSFPSPTRR